MESMETPMRKLARYDGTVLRDHAHLVQGDVFMINAGSPEAEQHAEELRENQRIRALYEALDFEGRTAREHQISLPEIPAQSFDWIWSDEARFSAWLQHSAAFFWIRGKPGSGKSTLMRYLSHSRTTTRLLNSGQSQYMMLEFFFDYRAGKSFANDIDGLLRAFLTQICQQASEVEKTLARKNARLSFEQQSSKFLLDLLCTTIQSLPQRLCAFVDGLDEYRGDYVSLVNTLWRLHDRTNIRIVFASRPEPALVDAFENTPQLQMQDFNASSIHAYINYAIRRARGKLIDVDSIFDSHMIQRIQERAEGVIIWARLAVDELYRVAHGSPSKLALENVLEQLPGELEEMYNLNLARHPPEFQTETSLLLFWLNAFGGEMTVKAFQGLWEVCQRRFLEGMGVRVDMSEPALMTRISTLLGSFVDIVDTQTRPQHYLETDSLFESYCDSGELGLTPNALVAPNGSLTNDDVQITRSKESGDVKLAEKQLDWSWHQIRLMHKTLEPYTIHSDLVQRLLPATCNEEYAYEAALSLSVSLIKEATEENILDLKKCFKLSRTRFYDNKKLPTDVEVGVWHRRFELLDDACTLVRSKCLDLTGTESKLYFLVNQALSSPLMHLYRYDTDDISECEWSSAFEAGCIDLLFAISLGAAAYVETWIAHATDIAPQQWSHFLELSLREHGMQSDKTYNPRGRKREVQALLASKVTVVTTGVLQGLYAKTWNKPDESDTLVGLLASHMKISALHQHQSFGGPAHDCGGNDDLFHWWLLEQRVWTYGYVTLSLILHACPDVNRQCKRNGTTLHLMLNECAREHTNGSCPLVWFPFFAALGVDPTIRHQGFTVRDLARQLAYVPWQARLSNWLGFTSPPQKTHVCEIGPVVALLDQYDKYGTWPETGLTLACAKLPVGARKILEARRNAGVVKEEDLPLR